MNLLQRLAAERKEQNMSESPSMKPDEPPKLGDVGYLPPVNFGEFRNVVEGRRSIRIYDQTPVPPEVINDCLDMALLAPNSSNLQPWEFYWVRSNEKKQALVKACLSQPAAATAQELIVIVARLDTWRKHRKHMLNALQESSAPKAVMEYYQKLILFAYSQGFLGIFGLIKRLMFFTLGLFSPTPRGPASFADMRVLTHKTCALAAENLMLAARAHGFDSCPMEGFDESRVKKLLGLPCRAEVVMVVSIGKRAPKGVYGKRMRFERSWFVKEV